MVELPESEDCGECLLSSSGELERTPSQAEEHEVLASVAGMVVGVAITASEAAASTLTACTHEATVGAVMCRIRLKDINVA